MNNIQNKKVAILVLNWNNKLDSVNCVKSLMSLKFSNFNIVFIDNKSDDGSVDAVIEILIGMGLDPVIIHSMELTNFSLNIKNINIEKENKRVFIIKNSENLGYTGGFNVGLSFVLEFGKFDYVWVLNNDTVVEEDSLTKLVECLEYYKSKNINVGGAGTLLLYPDGNIQTVCGNKLNKLIGNSSFLKKDKKHLGYITGASLFLDIDALKNVGLFDERFFLYWDDADYSLRLKKMGYKLICCDDAVVYHKEGGTAGRINKLNDYYWVRNGLLFTWKHQPYFLPFVILAYIFKYTVLRTIKREPNNLSSLLLGIYHFFIGRFGKKP